MHKDNRCSFLPRVVLITFCWLITGHLFSPAGKAQSCCSTGCTDACTGACINCDQDVNDCGSPLIVDVTGNGFSLTSVERGVDFDFFGTGSKVRISWTNPEAGNAWLVLDRNHNGVIDNGREMFGNFTPQPSSTQKNGFLALAVFDRPENGGNGDGIIDMRDAIYSQLQLWVDKNHNGISEPDELFTLPQLGIESISLDYHLSRRVDEFGNVFRFKSSVREIKAYHIDNTIYDVFLVIRLTP